MNVLSEIKEDRKRLEDDYGLDLSSEQKEKNKKIHDKIRKNDDKVLTELNETPQEIRFESEKNDRISHLLEPSDQKEFEANLMWMTQQGTEKDYPLILKLSKKPPFDSPSIQHFFKECLEKTKPSLTFFKRRPNLIEKVISIFKPEIKYTSPQALEKLTKKLKKDSISLEAARILSEKSDFLSLKSFDYIHDKFPKEIPNESEQKNKFVTNISDCIASISYCLIANNSEPIDLLRNQNKDKLELELPKNLYIEAINYIKNHHELSKEASSQANYYINKLLDILGES